MSSCVNEILPQRSTSVNSSAYIRKLTAFDEAQFIKLLRAVYGDTYSYDILYEPGGYSSLINSEQLTSYGEFDSDNRLLAHTGFWHKEKNSDYVESGSSFRLPAGSSEFKSSSTQAAWREVLHNLSREYTFIHQHCSTLHVLAQRYASQFMNAKPCGFILGYAQDEKIKGVAHCAENMHALMMTSVLRIEPFPEQDIYVPELFKSWISTSYQNLNIPRKVYGLNSAPMIIVPEINLDTLESNSYISLLRRRVLKAPEPTGTIQCSSKRTDLIHLPLDSPELVSSVVPMLLDLGYLPCGLRPHIQQPDELIFQRFDGYRNVIGSLLEVMKIANKNTKEWIDQWQKIVLQIM